MKMVMFPKVEGIEGEVGEGVPQPEGTQLEVDSCINNCSNSTSKSYKQWYAL